MIPLKELYNWCKLSVEDLKVYDKAKIPFKIVGDSTEMGELIAREFLDEIKLSNSKGKPFRAIVPCGPKCWYKPFTDMVNKEKISLKNLHVFHMDECLDWQGNLLPKNHPYNFRTFMETHFYNGIESSLRVPLEQRFFPEPNNIAFILENIQKDVIDITIGGWGQDGHIAYNQARRHPYNSISIDDLKASSIRIQENNWDTIMALSQRSFGGAYQFVPPMSITLGLKECLSAKKVRLYSDTGSWKQTAFRVALFSSVTTEYPITLLQTHKDARITATEDTAAHPISENLEWKLI